MELQKGAVASGHRPFCSLHQILIERRCKFGADDRFQPLQFSAGITNWVENKSFSGFTWGY